MAHVDDRCVSMAGRLLVHTHSVAPSSRRGLGYIHSKSYSDANSSCCCAVCWDAGRALVAGQACNRVERNTTISSGTTTINSPPRAEHHVITIIIIVVVVVLAVTSSIHIATIASLPMVSLVEVSCRSC